MTTKEKILQTSQQLFNEQGFGAPTLNSIAQTIGISRGNLTYYFKDKEALLEELIEEMWAKYQANIGNAMKFPSWSSTNNTTRVFLDLQKEYAFIFFDRKVASHPSMVAQIKRMKKDLLERQMSIIAFSIQIGNMKEETIPGLYQNLCETLWMINFYWAVSESYRAEDDKTHWDKLIWSAILPHFTAKGLESFVNHFGQDYLETLGDAFTKVVHF